jgi:hypothetical protein
MVLFFGLPKGRDRAFPLLLGVLATDLSPLVAMLLRYRRG